MMQTIFKVIVPAAKSGIITAVVLGTGRAIGEAMAISLVSGSSVNFPLPFNSVRFLTTAIVSEMSYSQGLHREVLFTIGLVLFVFIMIINISLTRILKKGDRENDITVSTTKASVRRTSILLALIYMAAGFSIFLLIGIMGYVFVRGIPQISWEFLSTVPSTLKGTNGIVGNIVNTLYIIVITLVIATPIGVGAAIYLNEYARPGRLVRLIEFTTETLSGIPSIIFGLFGMVFFGIQPKAGVFDSYRLLHADADGPAADYQDHAGGIKNGARQLPLRRSRNRCDEMVHDPDDSSAQRGAGNPDRNHPLHRPYRGRVGGPIIHRGQRISAPEKSVYQSV